MHQTERTAGFTLIEVSLAIVIGLIVLAGAVALFQQGKVSAQNSAAKEKLGAVSIVIEEFEARSYGYPTLDQLRVAWKTRRPDDYATSPWGGALTVVGDDFIAGNDLVGLSAEIGGSSAGTPHGGTNAAVDRGRIYYFRRDPAVAGPPYLWLDELSFYGPEDTESVYRVKSYGVAYLGPEGQQWQFVAGDGKTNAEEAGRFYMGGGQIGD